MVQLAPIKMDLTLLFYFSWEGDADFPQDYHELNLVWLLWLNLQKEFYPKHVQDALPCAMRGWNANPGNVDKTVDEIIAILEQAEQAPSRRDSTLDYKCWGVVAPCNKGSLLLECLRE